MTPVEIQVVEMLGEGLTRWKIAEKMGLSESTVRRIIRRLCTEYGCTQRELPDVTRKENGG